MPVYFYLLCSTYKLVCDIAFATLKTVDISQCTVNRKSVEKVEIKLIISICSYKYVCEVNIYQIDCQHIF